MLLLVDFNLAPSSLMPGACGKPTSNIETLVRLPSCLQTLATDPRYPHGQFFEIAMSLSKAEEDNDAYTQQSSEGGRLAESSLIAGSKPGDAPSNHRGDIRASSSSPSLLSIDDSSNTRLGRNPEYVSFRNGHRRASRSPTSPRTMKGRMQDFWTRNKGLALVLISQFFGALMNVTTRMLEMEGNDGKELLRDREPKYANICLRKRISSLSDSIRKDEYHRDMRFCLYVAKENGVLSLGHERSPITTCSSRLDGFLWSFWNVL